MITQIDPRPSDVEPNLRDYDAERASFEWEQARARLAGLPAGAGLNIAHEALDRHLGTEVEVRRWPAT